MKRERPWSFRWTQNWDAPVTPPGWDGALEVVIFMLATLLLLALEAVLIPNWR